MNLLYLPMAFSLFSHTRFIIDFTCSTYYLREVEVRLITFFKKLCRFLIQVVRWKRCHLSRAAEGVGIR